MKQQLINDFKTMEDLMRTHEEKMRAYIETQDKDEVRTIFKKAKGVYANVIDLRLRGLHCCIYLSDIPECERAMNNIREMLGRMRYLKHSI